MQASGSFFALHKQLSLFSPFFSHFLNFSFPSYLTVFLCNIMASPSFSFRLSTPPLILSLSLFFFLYSMIWVTGWLKGCTQLAYKPLWPLSHTHAHSQTHTHTHTTSSFLDFSLYSNIFLCVFLHLFPVFSVLVSLPLIFFVLFFDMEIRVGSSGNHDQHSVSVISKTGEV